MNGFATRNALHAINEHCAPGTEAVERRHDRHAVTSSRSFGYRSFADAEDIPAPTFLPNAHGLGTPGEAVRLAAIRRENLFRRVFWSGMAGVIVCGVFIVGLNTPRPGPVATGIGFKVKAQRLGAGQMRCALDPAEDCLVCMHKDERGIVTVASHC